MRIMFTFFCNQFLNIQLHNFLELWRVLLQLLLQRSMGVPIYIQQSLELTKSYNESIFGKEKEKQEGLQKWF